MNDPATITPERLTLALRALVKIQAQPMSNAQLKAVAWDALDLLEPELSVLTPIEAFKRVYEK